MSVLTIDERKVLVLNKSWSAISIVSMKKALGLLLSTHENGQPKAKIIDHKDFERFSWSDWAKMRPEPGDDNVLVGANITFRVPEVILLTHYDKKFVRKQHYSRRAIYRRDGNRCQYCGRKPGTEELTIDHIHPRSRGGLTTWDNTCCACIACNIKKANRTPEEAGMKLLSVPARPKAGFRADHKFVCKSWDNFISEAFWFVELENDNKD